MAELAGVSAKVSIAGTPASAATEALEFVTANLWQVASATKRVLESGVTLEANYGAGWVDLSYASVNLLNGQFTFSGVGVGSGNSVRIKAGNYVPMSEAAYCHGFTLNKSATLHDVTAFQDTDRKRKVGPKSASGTLRQWDVTSDYFADALVAGNPIVIEYLPSTGGTAKRLWAMLDSQELQAALDSAQDEAVSFQSDDYTT